MEQNPEYEAFTDFMDKLVRVPHSTIKRGMTVHRKKAAANPKRRGPKPKVNASASDPASDRD